MISNKIPTHVMIGDNITIHMDCFLPLLVTFLDGLDFNEKDIKGPKDRDYILQTTELLIEAMNTR